MLRIATFAVRRGVFPSLNNVVHSSFSRPLKVSYLNTASRDRCSEREATMDWAQKNELKTRLVWVDLEMTGLDVDKCHILEIACLVTDSDLNVVAEAPNLIINQPEERLSKMDEWCTTHHTDSGLLDAVRASKVSVQQAEYEMLAFIRQHTMPRMCPLAGNTVYVDKTFLQKYMPQFTDHLHYRIVDVSTIKELCRRWYPEQFNNAPRKKAAHRALDDILESIKEMNYYRKAIFK